MKSKIILLTIFLATCLVPVQVNGQQEYIKQDSMTFTLLSFSYYGYEFLGGHVSYHPLCDNYCEWNEIPIQYQYVTWGDFFEENFFYKFNNDLLFRAPYGWMNGGWTDPYPESFWPVDSFPDDLNNVPVSFPIYVKYYYNYMIPAEEFRLRADSVWKTASTLEIVREYAQYAHWVGFFCWPYNVQIYPNIDPATRWVIMLYYGNDFVTGLQSDQGNQGFVKVYPNPAKDRLRLDFGEEKIYLPKTLHLYDSFGRLHQSIELAPGIVEVDINKLTQGIYTGVAMSQEKQLGVFKFIVC